MNSVPILEINDLQAWYDESHVLHGINLKINPGEVVTLLGRNGAGRTTILRSLLGIMVKRQGSIKIHGEETISMPTHKIAHLGIGYCPEERGIFSALSCEENILLPPKLKNITKESNKGMSLEDIYKMFPNLYERRLSPGTRLSGGEQQMLAVARIIRTGANFLLLDEISEGLAPVIVQALSQMIISLKNLGYTVLMVEQNFHFAANLADRFYVIEHGKVVENFTASELAEKQDLLTTLLGV